MPDSDHAKAAAADDDLGPLAPFRHSVFTMLWSTWLVANLCMWMNDVAAAWLMTTLTSKPIWVALVQTAATLPVFLLGLPSGALADILNRKHFLFFTQVWVAVVGALLALAVFMKVVTPPLLLMLLFMNGVGLALRWPVFSAIVPDLVPRAKLPAALALNGVSMNASRILGPLIAGSIIASLGSAWVFLLNAVLSVGAAVVITRWQREHKPDPLGRESLRGSLSHYTAWWSNPLTTTISKLTYRLVQAGTIFPSCKKPPSCVSPNQRCGTCGSMLGQITLSYAWKRVPKSSRSRW